MRFWEAMKALEEGRKVRLKHWKPNEFIQSHLGGIIRENGARARITKYFGDAGWEIIKEKRTVQVEGHMLVDGTVYECLREENERLKQTVTSYEEERYPFSAGDMVRENKKLKSLCDEMAKALEFHNKWHEEIGTVSIEGCEIDLSIEYSDSSLFEITYEVLTKYREMMGEK